MSEEHVQAALRVKCDCGDCPDEDHLREFDARMSALEVAAQALCDLRGAEIDLIIDDPQMGGKLVVRHFEPAPKENN